MKERGPWQKRGPEHPENLSIEGRIPPHDDAAEKALLSTLMLRLDGAIAVDEVSPICSPEDMYGEANRRIYEACIDLAAKGNVVDVVQVRGWLKDQNRLAQVDGAGYLSEVLDGAPHVSPKHLAAYATRIANLARMRRVAYRLQQALAQIFVGVPDDESEEFFGEIERDVGNLCASRHAGGLVPVGPIVKKVITNFETHEREGGGILGVATGFTRYDRLTGGLHGGDLNIVGARPGMGKTALVMGICDNVTERNYAGAVFSLEMPKEQLVARLLCSRGKVNLSKSRTGTFSPADWQKLTQSASEIFPREIYIDDQGGQTIEMIRSKTRRLVTRLTREGKKLGVVIIDYLQLMRKRARKGGESLSELIGEITRGLKELAKELHVPIVLLSQLNREVEKRPDKHPMISDLRDSGEIEQDADNIVFIYRDDHYDAESEERNLAEIIIAKQRNGPVGMVRLRFDKEWTRFDNLAEGDDRDHPTDDGQPYEREPREEQESFNTEGL